jgi:hypothetical protein
MAVKNYEDVGSRRAILVGTALYSLLFIYFITSGYAQLFQKTMPFFGYVAGLIFAIIAWSIAKIIGSDEGGISKYKPLFALLLLISALGIFNALFSILESRPILEETVKDSNQKFSAVKIAAQRAQEKRGITERLAAVDDALSQLTAEINNPMKCGQGPKAMEAVGKLAALLPGFEPLASGTGAGCDQASAVVSAYTSKVSQMKANAAWNNPELQAVVANSEAAIAKLDKAKLKAVEGSVPAVSRILDEVDPVYSASVLTLQRYDGGGSLPAELDLVQMKSIGEWSQILNLIIGRISKPSTYVYFAVAVFADWMMIYFFALLRGKSRGFQNRGSRATPNFRAPW